MQDYTKLRDKWLMFEAAEKKTKSKKPKGGWNFEKGKNKKDEEEVEEDATVASDVAGVPTKLGKKAGKKPVAKAKKTTKESSHYKLNRTKGSTGNKGLNKMVEDDFEDVEGEELDDMGDVDAMGDAGIEDIESEVAGEDLISKIQAAYPGLEVVVTVKGEIPPELETAASEVSDIEGDELGAEEGLDDLDDGEVEEGLNLSKFLEDDMEDEIDDVESVDDDMDGAIDDLEGDEMAPQGEVSLSVDQWEQVLGGESEIEGDNFEGDLEADDGDYAEESFRVAKMAGNFKNFREALNVAKRYLKKKKG